jgi:hypothetical protein
LPAVARALQSATRRAGPISVSPATCRKRACSPLARVIQDFVPGPAAAGLVRTVGLLLDSAANATEGSGMVTRCGRGTSDLVTGIQARRQIGRGGVHGADQARTLEDLSLALASDHGREATAGNNGALISALLVAPAGFHNASMPP